MIFFSKNFDRIASCLLCLMVFTIPIQILPKAYPVPGFMKNVGGFFLWLLLAVSVLRFWNHRESYGKWPSWLKKYLAVVCIWPILCTLLGAVSFPYWNETVNEFLRHTGVVEKIALVYPGILENTLLLHLKYAGSSVMRVVQNLLIPFLGVFFSLYVMFYQKDSRYILNTVSRAATVAALGLCVYSSIEIPWLLTGNEWCADVLKWINVHLYDVKTSHEWWPPLLWGRQLRSFTREPSFFGIMAAFIVPLLWYRAAVLREKIVWLLLVFFCYMIFLTHARTAQVIFLGELVLLTGFSLWGRYSSWRKSLVLVFSAAMLAFAFYIAIPALLSSENSSLKSCFTMVNDYVEQDVMSVGDASKRSNTARLGNTVALFTVGLKHPVFGVGMGFVGPYIADHFPAFAQNDGEVKHWISMLQEEGFLKSPIPILNMFGDVMCCYGIPGLLLFLIPSGMVFFHFLKNRRKLLQSGGMVCVLTALGGQLASLMSNGMFYTYPLILAAAWLLMWQLVKESGSTR